MTYTLLRYGALACALGFLLFGLVRLGIGAAMFGMVQGWWSLGGEFAQVLPETRDFLARYEGQALFPWTVSSYFAFIVLMGLVLVTGAALYLFGGKGLGLLLVALYLALHGGMFVNYQLVNPKIWLWAATVAMWAVMLWSWRRVPVLPAAA